MPTPLTSLHRTTPHPESRRAVLERERREASHARRTPHPSRSKRILALIGASLALASIVATSMPGALFTATPPTTSAAIAAATVPVAAPSVQAFVASDTPDSVVIRDNFAVTAAPARVVEVAAETGVTPASSSLGAVQWPFPTQVRTSDGFGPRVAPCSGCSTNHKGLDMLPGEGTPIGVVADGVVRETGETDEGFGNYAVVDHVVDGQLVSTLYAHMQWGSLTVSEGQPVKAGQILGNVGSTGMSTGPHLHLEVWEDGVDPVDPAAWLSSNAN